MVTAKFIHEHFLGIARSIMYDQPPDVRRVLGLCAAVFLVRELGELQLEQELSARLIFLYRSPRTVIKWAHRRPPARKPPCCQGSRGAVGSSRHVLRPFGLGEAGSLPQPWVPLMPSPCSCSPAESPGLRPPLCPHKGDSVPPLLPDPASCSLCGVGGGDGGGKDSASCLEKALDHLGDLWILQGFSGGSWSELPTSRPLSTLMTREGSWPLWPLRLPELTARPTERLVTTIIAT